MLESEIMVTHAQMLISMLHPLLKLWQTHRYLTDNFSSLQLLVIILKGRATKDLLLKTSSELKFGADTDHLTYYSKYLYIEKD